LFSLFFFSIVEDTATDRHRPHDEGYELQQVQQHCNTQLSLVVHAGCLT
jgi:hypothetical protein